MSFANKHNKANSNVFTYEQIADAPFIKLKDLYAEHQDPDHALMVRGMFINDKSRYGRSAALICDGFNVNLPGHMVNEVEQIMNDPDDVAAINAGRVMFYVRPYESKTYKTTAYAVTWVDVPVAADDLPF